MQIQSYLFYVHPVHTTFKLHTYYILYTYYNFILHAYFYILHTTYPVFKSNCNQQKLYCVKTISITKFGFFLSESISTAVSSCKISPLFVQWFSFYIILKTRPTPLSRVRSLIHYHLKHLNTSQTDMK